MTLTTVVYPLPYFMEIYRWWAKAQPNRLAFYIHFYLLKITGKISLSHCLRIAAGPPTYPKKKATQSTQRWLSPLWKSQRGGLPVG
jgi:hypothetical protein